MNIKKGIPIVILILSAAVFLLLTAASSPYRELRPYRFFGRTGPEKIGLNTMMVNGRLAVMISGTEDTEPFYIDQIPVTVGAYKKCTALGSCQTQHYRNYYAQFYAGNIFNSFPMTFVTFNEARTYCMAYGGDLPTESQWLAANGSGDYAWGDQDPTLSRANLDGFYQWQTPAGWLPKGAGPYGILDMNGNVREWILDENPVNRSEKGLKGGGFQDDFGACENDYTFYHEPTSSGFNRGFRCVYPARQYETP